MIHIVLFLGWDNLTPVGNAPTDVDLDVLRPDDLGQVLQRVEHLIPQVTVDHLQVSQSSGTLPSLSPLVKGS